MVVAGRRTVAGVDAGASSIDDAVNEPLPLQEFATQ